MVDRPMTLPETALSFAREILGWNNCVVEPDLLIFETFPGQDLWGRKLAYTDLNVVLEAARAWHRKNGLFVAMYFYPQIDAVMVAIFDDNRKVEAEEADPCHALMLACLQAARKLREAA